MENLLIYYQVYYREYSSKIEISFYTITQDSIYYFSDYTQMGNKRVRSPEKIFKRRNRIDIVCHYHNKFEPMRGGTLKFWVDKGWILERLVDNGINIEWLK